MEKTWRRFAAVREGNTLDWHDLDVVRGGVEWW